jgi:pantoate--beta-alanine ligase
MECYTTCDELRAALAQQRARGRTIGLVPTMGALHEGHLSLVDASLRECDHTVVTIFVNPTQFGPQEDYSRYPRTLEEDLAALAARGAHTVFAPSTEEMYRPGHVTFVEMQGVALPLEGQRRPGHFRGVATIVLKLFTLVLPDRAYFGQKDYQQSLVVRRLVADLNLDVQIRLCPIVRDADGLALSSRNRYLSPQERRQALLLHQALQHVASRVAGGERNCQTLLSEIEALFAAAPGVRLDYASIADPDTLAPLERIEGPAVCALAAFVGTTRLIDNTLLAPPQARA